MSELSETPPKCDCKANSANSQNFHYTNGAETPTSPFYKKQKIHLKLDHRSDPVLLKVKKIKLKKKAQQKVLRYSSRQNSLATPTSLKKPSKSESTREEDPG